jgi:hypothetical protein
MSTTPEVGIDYLTMLDVPPPELVTIAREAGFDLVACAWPPRSPAKSPGR